MDREFKIPDVAELPKLLFKLQEGTIRSCLERQMNNEFMRLLNNENTPLKESETEERVNEQIEELKKCIDHYGTEDGHIFADEILLNIIAEYGHPEVKEIFDKIDKWYA